MSTHVTRNVWQIHTGTILSFPILTVWRPLHAKSRRYAQLVDKFSTFYGNHKFITVVTRARHRFLPWARGIQSILMRHISLRLILLLLFHFRCVLFFSHFLTKILDIFLVYQMHSTCPFQLTVFYMISLKMFGAVTVSKRVIKVEVKKREINRLIKF
jgi:hypothetical protein